MPVAALAVLAARQVGSEIAVGGRASNAPESRRTTARGIKASATISRPVGAGRGMQNGREIAIGHAMRVRGGPGAVTTNLVAPVSPAVVVAATTTVATAAFAIGGRVKVGVVLGLSILPVSPVAHAGPNVGVCSQHRGAVGR